MESDGNTALSQKSDLQSVEDFFHNQSPSLRISRPNKSSKSNAKMALQAGDGDSQSQQLGFQSDGAQPGMLPLPISNTHSPLDHAVFPHQHATQLYSQSCNNSYPQPYDLLPLSTPVNTAILPQLDRHLVYGAYAGNDPTGASSASALDALTQSHHDPGNSGLSDPNTQTWDNPMDLSAQQQQRAQILGSDDYMGDLQTSAWFMPFNLNPPEFGEDEDSGKALHGFGEPSGQRLNTFSQ